MTSSSSLTFVSCNVNGINNKQKKAQIIAHIELLEADVVFLCDSRLGPNGQADFINSYPNYLFFFNSPSSNSRGTDILIKRTCPIKILDNWSDDIGNINIISTIYDGEKLVLCSVYGPNNDSPLFFQSLFDKLTDFGPAQIIVGGDFNVPINPVKDTLGYRNITMSRARRVILDALQNGTFIDPFRKIHKDKNEYTWSRFGGGQSARLDYFLTSSSIQPFLESCHSAQAFRSDHKPILLKVDFKKVARGKGIWKFNNKLLLDNTFLELASNEIKTTCAKYLVNADYPNFINDAPIDEVDNFLLAPLNSLEHLQYNIDYDMLLVCIFNDIKNLTISYVSGRDKAKKLKAKELLNKIELLPPGDDKNDLLESYNNIIDDIANEHLSLIAKLSKTKGERPSKWFLSLEKSNNQQKFIGELINNQGLSLTSQKDIESEICNFYKSLYSKSISEISSVNEIHDFLPQNCPAPRLTGAQVTSLEADISLQEVAAFLKKTKNESCPGSSGITYQFIKSFFSPLGFFISKASRDIFRKEVFPQVFRTGFISLLPKGDKNKKLLANWRPICLLDSTYKIIAGVLTQRINTVLPSIIANTQSGFIPGRCINDSLRLLADILEYAKKNEKAGILLNLDYKKAFDCLSHSFIHKALLFFGFGPNFIKWIQITQAKFIACTVNSGNVSPCFPLNRGVKQGDPISPALFVISIEILSLRIKHDHSIKGFEIGNLIIKQSYFADDTLAILRRCEASVRNCVAALDQFAQLSGLHINRDKSSMIEFGITPAIPFCPELPFKRVKTFTHLGIIFTSDLSGMEVNIESKLKEIDVICKNWKNRNLSIYGKNIIAKTLLLSKINNVIMVIPNLKKKTLADFESRIYQFIWGGADKVRRYDAKICEKNGGLNLPNIYTSIHAFKIAWFRRLFSFDTVWSGILNSLLHDVSPRLSTENLLEVGDIGWVKIANKISSNFWKSVFRAPISPSRVFAGQNPESLIFSNIWDSSLLKLNNRSFSRHFHPSLRYKITYVSDLINPISGTFFTYDEFSILKGRPDRVKYDNIISSARALLQHHNIDISSIKIQTPIRPFWLFFFNITPKGCNGWTKLLRLSRSDNIRQREVNWETLLNKRFGPIYWDNVHKNLCSIKFDNKLKWFQYQLNRGCLKVNAIISKFKNHISDRCTFCGLHKEDIPHLFWNCTKVQDLFTSVSPFFNELNITWPPTNMECFLFGDHKSTFLAEKGYAYLQLKHYIWVSRCLQNDLSIVAFKNKFRYNLSLDFYHYGNLIGGGGRGGLDDPQHGLFHFIGSLADKVGIG